MHGSQLFGQQPTFRGVDFNMPEIAYLGFVQFRDAVATADSWDDHDGVELVFVRSGEACWEYPDNGLLRVNGGQGVLFPPNRQHRIVNGVYTPCQLVWMVFQPRELAKASARLLPPEEIDAIYDLASAPTAPVKLSDSMMRHLGALSTLMTDDNVLIGSRLVLADLRATFYAALVDFWKVLAQERGGRTVNPIVREAERLLSEEVDSDEDINALSARLGCRKSHLYQLFKQELGMAPNDYRQRLRIKRSCEALTQTDAQVTDIAMQLGYNSSQYFSRVFRKYVGFTPRDYRQLFREQHDDAA